MSKVCTIYTERLLTQLNPRDPNDAKQTTQIHLHTDQALIPSYEHDQRQMMSGNPARLYCAVAPSIQWMQTKQSNFGLLDRTILLQADVGRVKGSSRCGCFLGSVGKGKIGSPGDTDGRNKGLFAMAKGVSALPHDERCLDVQLTSWNCTGINRKLIIWTAGQTA